MENLQAEFNRLMRNCIALGVGCHEAEHINTSVKSDSLVPGDKVSRARLAQVRKEENDAWGELNTFIDNHIPRNWQGEVRDDTETMVKHIASAMFTLRHSNKKSLLEFESGLVVEQWFATFMMESIELWKRLGREQLLNNPLGY
jgi:hypothetical protein